MRYKGLLIRILALGLLLAGIRGHAQGFGYRKMDFLSDQDGILRDSQVWDITCADDKIYLATNDGLFVYDGARIRGIYSPQVSTLRDLAFDPSSGRLYSAGNNGYGWWQPDGLGGMSYQPLETGEYNARMQDFWRVCVGRGGNVFFQSIGRICIWSPLSGETLSVTPAAGFGYMYDVGGEVFVQDGNSLYRILEDGSLIFVCKAPDRIMNMVESGGQRIAALERTGLMKLEDGALIPLDTRSNRILSEAKVMSMATNGEELLVGTTQGGMFITDSSGKIVDKPHGETDTSRATVLSLAIDANGDIWIGMEAGVARINYKSNDFFLEDTRLGRVRRVVQLDGGGILAGTNKGAFICERESVRPVQGTTGSVWNVVCFDGVPYIAHDRGLFYLDRRETAIPIFEGTGVMSMVRCNTRPNQFICGTYNGLALFCQDHHGKPVFQSYIANYSGFSHHILIDSRDRLWIRDSQRGFIRLTLNQDNTAVVDRKDFVVVQDPHDVVYAIQLEGKLFLCCNRDAYGIDPQTEDLVRSEEGDHLLAGFIHQHGLPDDRKASVPYLLADGSYATGLLGRIRFSYGRKNIRESLYVSQAEVLGVRKRQVLDVKNVRHNVPFDMNTAVIFLGGNLYGNDVEYRTVPGANVWHNVQFNQPVQIPSLPFGDHDIEFRIADNPEIGCTVKLHILRPWYLNGWAIAVYVLLLAAFALGIRAYYIRQTRKEQERIRLKEDLKAKSKELANISFNNAKRNRELNEIKSMLTDRKTVALIDGYLSDESDWEKSEEYFNVIYDGLLEKLKSMYPGISKTDMKICVYTKLNLSTKEIADIMNISVRSVEMARYRLRKRLNLPPGQDISQMLKEIE